MLPNPWILLGIGIAFIASVLTVGGYEHHAGATAENAKWEQRYAQETAQAAATINKLQTEARTKEAAYEAGMVALAGNYQKELKNEQDQSAADLAAVRAGALSLRDPFATGTLSAGPSSAGTITASAGSGHGAPGCELSQPTAEFLVGEADRADGIVRQLDACQAIVVQDRQECGK